MKWIWVAFIIWCAIVLFVPMVHVLPIPANTLAFAKALVCIPWLALAMLWYLHKRPDSFLKSLITVDIASGAIIAVMLIIVGVSIKQSVDADKLIWPEAATLITVSFLLLLLMRKYSRCMEESKAILLSVIVGAFAMSAFEIPYQLTPSLVGLSCDVPILMQVCFLAVPFGVVLYKLRLTKWTVMLIAMWVVLWCIWVFSMDRWDVSQAVYGGEPIQWLPYQLSKGIKLFLVLLLYSLNVKQSIAFIKPLPVV